MRDVAETKTTIKNIDTQVSTIAGRLDKFVTREEFTAHVRRDEEVITTRVNPLWDSHNELKGQQATNQRHENWFRWAIGAIVAILTVWALLRQAGILH